MSTKRDRLLDWIRNGDAQDIPLLMGLNNFSTASSRLGENMNDLTWDDAIVVAKETGTHLLACTGMPMLFEAIDFIDDIKLEKKRETVDGGTISETTVITTPDGVLKQVYETPVDVPGYHREHLIKGKESLSAFSYLIHKTTEAIVNNPAIRAKIKQDCESIKAQVKGELPTMLWLFIPAVELMSCYFIDQESAIFLMYDYQEQMGELMECHWRMTEVWLEMGKELGVDIYGYAINGYEWLNPDLYERFMVPQARRLNDAIEAQGALSWIHTCGKIKKIAEAGFYQQMNVDILESFAMLPTGDIDDLSQTRQYVGHEIVSRGGIDCDLLYLPNNQKNVRERTEYILESVKGFKHIIGDVNPPCPGYPWENIQTVIDVVRESGRLFE